MNKVKIDSDQQSNSKASDRKLKFLLDSILALSKKQRKKIFIELSKYDL